MRQKVQTTLDMFLTFGRTVKSCPMVHNNALHGPAPVKFGLAQVSHGINFKVKLFYVFLLQLQHELLCFCTKLHIIAFSSQRVQDSSADFGLMYPHAWPMYTAGQNQNIGHINIVKKTDYWE